MFLLLAYYLLGLFTFIVCVIQLLNHSSFRYLELQWLDFPSWKWCFLWSFTLCRSKFQFYQPSPEEDMYIRTDDLSGVETIK